MKQLSTQSLIAILVLLVSPMLHAQDMSGNWQGNYGKQLLMTQPKQLVVEITILNDSIVTGATHLYYKNNKYEHYTMHGVFRKKDSTIYFKEDSSISINLGFMASNSLGNYTMKLRYTDSTMVLEGIWKDNFQGFLHSPKSTVYLIKPLPKKEVQQSMPLSTVMPNPVITRSTDLQSLIEYSVAEKDSITISLYDNGQIDGDTVSVYFNDTIIVSKRMLTAVPFRFHISMDPSIRYNKLRMIAESLGSIPPCTAVMVIETKSKRYQVNLSSDFSKNAAVEFFLKE